VSQDEDSASDLRCDVREDDGLAATRRDDDQKPIELIPFLGDLTAASLLVRSQAHSVVVGQPAEGVVAPAGFFVSIRTRLRWRRGPWPCRARASRFLLSRPS